MIPGSKIGIVEVGDHVLEVGDPAGTAVKRGAEPGGGDADSLANLSAALKADAIAPGGETTPVEAVAELVDEASAATTKVEKAVAVGKGLARGEALDPMQLGLEVDAMLGLLERLDRKGRWKEGLRLARALSTLYSLLRRWLELLRSLNAALRAGEELGDPEAIAWAKHELGTLKVAAGDVGGGARDLGEALQIRRRLGDRRGIAASEHNLRTLCGQLCGTPPTARRPRLRRLSLPLVALATLMLLGAGLAGGVVGNRLAASGGGDHGKRHKGQKPPGHDGIRPGNKLLRISVGGDGSGTIGSEPPGIDCGEDCEQAFPRDRAVTLTADANEGSVFTGFSGACRGGNPCVLRLTAPSSIKASFAIAHTLTVVVEGPGNVRGGAAGNPDGIYCGTQGPVPGYTESLPRAVGNDCSAEIAEGDVVELTVEPADGLDVSMVGCDTKIACNVTMKTSREVTAIFGPIIK